MPAKKETQDYVRNELPYKLLMSLYENSRASLREIGKKLNISYHVVQSVLKDLESKYNIAYTLELDETNLGFTEGRIITLKFGIKPNIDFIKETIKKDFFVQDAYLAEGDFDLLLYVVGVEPSDFLRWQWNLRVGLSEYEPMLKFANVSSKVLGFFPLRNDLIKESTVLTNSEKAVLAMLNENSRVKLSDMVKKLKIKPDRAIYIIKKLKNLSIIQRFSGLTQNPDKRIIVAYGDQIVPTKDHKKLVLALANERLKEDFHEVVNDYALVTQTDGGWDGFSICVFRNGEESLKKGAELVKSLWADEKPKIDKAILTDVIVGKWPFHLEEYASYKKILQKT